MLLQACLNGARAPGEHPALPLSPAELARDAAACVGAGARSLHVHPRDGDGAESLEPEAIGAAVEALRGAVPGTELTLSTGLWIVGGDQEARLACVRRWTALPDACSVNVGEAGWQQLVAALTERGGGVEIGLSSRDGAIEFAASGLDDRCLRVLVEPRDEDPGTAVATAGAIDAVLGEVGIALPRLHHGLEVATWAVLDAAVPAGRDIRIGLEDTFALPEGGRAESNAALVAAARERYE
jgi:uncharacterized protein (DUF849 family)